MLNNSVSNKSFIIKTLLYGSAITVIVVALLLGSFMPQNVAYADTEESYINFNQLFRLNTENYSNSNFEKINDYTFIIKVDITSSYWAVPITTVEFTSGHKYFIKVSENLTNWSSFAVGGSGYIFFNKTRIFTADSSANCNYLYLYQNETAKTLSINVFDLTQMFGTETANSLTVEQCEQILPTYYSYTLGTVINESNATDYASGYVDGVNDTLNNFTVNATMGDSYNFLTTVDYQNYASKITKEIITINNQQYYGCVCLGYVKLPFYIRGSTSLKLNILAFGPWGAGADMDPTIYYDIGYIYNGEFINLYNTSMPKTADGIQNAEFEFFIPVDIDGIVFNCSEQYMLVNITAQYITYDVQDAIYKAEQRGYDNGHDNGYKLGKAEGYELGSRSTDNLLIGGFWNWFTSMLSSISSILDIELYGGISIGVVILVPLLFTVLLLVLKLVRGDG